MQISFGCRLIQARLYARQPFTRISDTSFYGTSASANKTAGRR